MSYSDSDSSLSSRRKKKRKTKKAERKREKSRKRKDKKRERGRDRKARKRSRDRSAESSAHGDSKRRRGNKTSRTGAKEPHDSVLSTAAGTTTGTSIPSLTQTKRERAPPQHASTHPTVTEPPKRRPMVPMTQEEYLRKQREIREVYDEQSGRVRLVRGTGEIIERIVSSSEHASINRRATRGDGDSFARGVFASVSLRRGRKV